MGNVRLKGTGKRDQCEIIHEWMSRSVYKFVVGRLFVDLVRLDLAIPPLYS